METTNAARESDLPLNLEAPSLIPESRMERIEPVSVAAASTGFSWLRLPFRILTVLFRLACLSLLLAIAASTPILQWGSLGYLFEVSGRMAQRRPWKEVVPGLELSGKIGWIAIAVAVTSLPVAVLVQFAYQAELIEPGSVGAQRWRMAAGLVASLWSLHVLWAVVRGGRWRDFLWPAPVRFFREGLKLATWRRVEDRLWDALRGLHLPSLIWLGLRGWVGTILWLAIPGGLMVIGMRAYQQPAQAAVGIVGFLGMWWVLLHLPFLQAQFAVEKRWGALFRLGTVRQAFRRAPWAFLAGLFATLGLAIPLYLLRIESPPDELLWLPCLFFVDLGLPARLSTGWALNRATRRTAPRWWGSRYLAWFLQLAIVPFYILFLYLGSLASWEGVAIVFFQHAFLTPVPFAVFY